MSLRIAINAQLSPNGGAGGTQTFLIGLIHALARLDGPEQYVLIGPRKDPEWLKPYTGPNQRIVRGPKIQAIKRALGPIKPLLRTLRRASFWKSGAQEIIPRMAASSGFYEKLDCSVIHFPYQHYVPSRVAAVFNPHDLQHVHYPEFFSAADFEWREVTYRAACEAANTVVVHSNWVKQDLVRHYKLSPNKIQVILTPPPVQAYAEPTAETQEIVRTTYKVDNRFAFYPAVTWKNKNHIRLLEALALLRDRGTKIELICTGHQTDFFTEIQKAVAQFKLHDEVRFLGMIPEEHLRAMYRLAEFTVLPTLFEGAGLPLVEAWAEGSPVTCSAVTSLLELAGDAALLFDPNSAENMAGAIKRMAEDVSLRETLVKSGFARLRNFNWETTAKAYRAVYRCAAGGPLTEEDRYILSAGRT